MKGRGQQGGADLHGRTDIIVSQSTQCAGNRWLRSGGRGLLRVTGACGAPHGVPLGTHAGNFTLKNQEWELCCQSFTVISDPAEVSLATHVQNGSLHCPLPAKLWLCGTGAGKSHREKLSVHQIWLVSGFFQVLGRWQALQ